MSPVFFAIGGQEAGSLKAIGGNGCGQQPLDDFNLYIYTIVNRITLAAVLYRDDREGTKGRSREQ